ncbi:DUF4980 domain-containing protein [uncultured Bacteroides sp.]|uniref:DUF4980 domain-containing protein n=1 Tax=uncultured Bacteroides sp. TaxID=162156 RepID=UPI00261BA49E|nr:DUF4980 domain-containing protein [uncultured Bacteroides sp.]
MKTSFLKIVQCAFAVALGFSSCQTTQSEMKLEQQGDSLTVVHITHPTKYLLLPIEEKAAESQVRLDTGDAADTDMDVRLAQTQVDYFVPFELPAGVRTATVRINRIAKEALCWKQMKLSDTFDTTNTDKFRPVYHHTPLYGWMNDANGLVYKDGEYHLYFQYNPYGSVLGNMHWGHSVSKDLMHWEHRAPAIARDTLGHIFSGSSVVDVNNTAGYGAGTIVAFYTSASDKNGQIQCMAYSCDNGNTYTKYEKNPVLTSFDGLKDFRDPKVFWYAPEEKWVMIVSADKEMRFYASKNLKEWEYLSAWGEGYGVQPRQFECPDMVQLPVNGDKSRMKWVMLVNVNPGCYFGGSATQYFVGDFDGTHFICDSPKETVKWLDWGKDHYATVCFSNTGDRVIGVPWMSNWQYANIVPTRQYRSANALPRELGLYEQAGELYVSAAPVKEVQGLRRENKEVPAFTIDAEYRIESLLNDNEGAYELELHFTNETAKVMGFKLFNEAEEEVNIYFDLPEGKLVMDRTKSGIVDFGRNSTPHTLEAHDRRVSTSINYRDDFALATWGPVAKAPTHTLNVFVDKCSVEIFLDGGKIAMTNLVFPNAPYNRMSFYGNGGSYRVDKCAIYKLEL